MELEKPSCFGNWLSRTAVICLTCKFKDECLKVTWATKKRQKTKLHMYKENRKSINWFVGCNHNCIYCIPSFQRQTKRRGKKCLKCYNYEPHAHLERLLKPPPKTQGKTFVFFPSSGDPAYASAKEWKEAISYTEKYSDVTFLVQSKDPICFSPYKFPDNVILDVTVETDLLSFNIKDCKYKYYSDISRAPYPIRRLSEFLKVKHKRKGITIEPILAFGSKFASFIQPLNPEFVYVGYDNHNVKLPEPSLKKTLKLIEELKKFTEVRVKTLRRGWWEK